MAAPTLSWTLNTERGSISFGRLSPFAGNTYDFTLAGTVYGQTYTAFLMSDDGLKCLAKSTLTSGVYSIAFNGADLREEFVRDMHEMKTFHLVVRDTEKCVAEGDLTIMWNPLWEDTETGEVYTMKGPKGNPGEPGAKGDQGAAGKSAYQSALDTGFVGTEEEWIESLRGQPGLTTMLYSDIDSKWHPVSITTNSLGNYVVQVDPTGQDENPDLNTYVTRVGAQTIAGVKTFSNSPIVPDIVDGGGNIDPTDNSTKAANTKWVAAKLTHWWSAIKSAAQSVTGTWTFANIGATAATAATLNVTDTFKVKDGETEVLTADEDGVYVGGDATIDGDLDIDGAIDASGTETHTGAESHAGAETHTGTETHSGAETHTGSVAVSGELDATNVKDAAVGISVADQAVTKAISEKALWDAVALVAPYLNANWVYVPGEKLLEGYNGSVEGAVVANETKWRCPGLASYPTGDMSAIGLYGFRTTEIEKYAVYSPNYLRKICFPNVTIVGKYAFYDADELEVVDLPRCTTIGEYAFYSTAALRTLNIQEMLTIGNYAFYDANYLNGVNAPKCKNVGRYAFQNAFDSVSGSVEVRIGENATLGTTAEDYNTIGQYAFDSINTAKIKKIIIPKTQVIGSYAFSDQREVVDIDITEAVTINDHAFYWLNYGHADGANSGIYQFDLNLTKVVTIGADAFGTHNGSRWLYSVKSLTAPILTSVGSHAFYHQGALRTLNCASLQSIADNAFVGCPINSISLPAIQSIGSDAFNGNAMISTLHIETAQNIGSNAFSGCTNLNNVYINKTREEIKVMANFPFGRATAACRFHGSNGYVDGTGNFG